MTCLPSRHPPQTWLSFLRPGALAKDKLIDDAVEVWSVPFEAEDAVEKGAGVTLLLMLGEATVKAEAAEHMGHEWVMVLSSPAPTMSQEC